ncbi:MAG: hypothetical protein LUG85_08845 [Clostridiales bacterium]|nr:hypothetical protein [Clostridiales bacterium]
MKKSCILIFFALLYTVVVSGCSTQENYPAETADTVIFGGSEMTYDTLEAPELIESGQSYMIFNSVSDEHTYYWYRIFDTELNVVIAGGTEWKKPQITESTDIIEVTINSGTSADSYIYYSQSSGTVSQVYDNVLDRLEESICYYSPSDRVLIVQNAFDGADCYRIARNFSDTAQAVIQAAFLESDILEFSYTLAEDESIYADVEYMY